MSCYRVTALGARLIGGTIMSELTSVYEVSRSQEMDEDWVAGAVDHESEGEIYIALFSGPGAEGRAREYADWKNGRSKTA